MALRPWVPTDLGSILTCWINPDDPTTWFEEEVEGGNVTLQAADLSAVFGPGYVGYYQGFGGSVSGEFIAGSPIQYFVGVPGSGVQVGFGTNVLDQLTGLTAINIDGVDFPVVNLTTNGPDTVIELSGTLTVGIKPCSLVGVSGGGGTTTKLTILDSSPNGVDFDTAVALPPTQRTVNGKTAMDIPNDIAAVLKPKTIIALNSITASNNSIFIACGVDNTTSQYCPFAMVNSGDEYALAFFRGSGSGGAWGYTNGQYLFSGDGFFGSRTNTSAVLSMIRTASNSYTARLDGNVEVNATGNDAFNFANNISIGGFIAPLGFDDYTFDGWIGDLVIIADDLSDTDRQHVEGYLAHKWGLTAGLPGAHPFKSAAPTIEDGGDPAPTITSPNSANNVKGTTFAHSLTANESVTWSIVGGADQASFEISGSTLRWVSNGVSSADGAKVVTIRATSVADSQTADQTITITVYTPYLGPTFIAAAVGTGGVNAGAVNFGASPLNARAALDMLFTAVMTANQASASPSGFTFVDPAPSQPYRGTAGAAGGVRVTVNQKTSTGSEGSITIADSGDITLPAGLVVRGADGAEVEIHKIAAGNAAASTSGSFGGVTTDVDNCLIVTFVATDRDNASASWTITGTGNQDNLAERVDAGTSAGSGGGIAIFTGEKIAAGATGTLTATQAASAAYVWITLALKNVDEGEPPAGLAVSFHFWL